MHPEPTGGLSKLSGDEPALPDDGRSARRGEPDSHDARLLTKLHHVRGHSESALIGTTFLNAVGQIRRRIDAHTTHQGVIADVFDSHIHFAA